MTATIPPAFALLTSSSLLAALPAQVAWQFNSATGPTAHYGANSALDTARNLVVMFGGRQFVTSVVNDTWEWDGSAWTPRQPAVSPSARSDAATCYDAARGRTLVFSGVDGLFSPIADMWSYDGTNWTQLAPAHMPPARDSGRMSYDARRQVVVLFGGVDSTYTGLDDTWEWDGSDWTQRNPAHAPTPRQAHGMCYDTARGVTLLFGGTEIPSNPVGDTWTWDGSDWTQLSPASAPAARWGHSLAYDHLRNRPLLVGGTDINGPIFDTAEWDGSSWVFRGANVGMRAHYSTLQVDARGIPVLFGSTSGSGPRFFEYVTQAPVGVSTFGSGCPGSNGTPRLDREPTTSPVIGATLRLRATSLATSATSMLMTFGLARTNIDLTAIGMPGCALSTSAEVVFSVPVAAGSATLPLAIPDSPALLGAALPAQGFVLDSGANALGLTATNGIEMRFGM